MRHEIKGYEGLYAVDETGNVYSIITTQSRRCGVMKPHEKNGYLAVTLFKDGKGVHKYVHRLVAESFIQNPDNLRYVNHIDGDKHNNRVENLEWCTQKQNIDHSWKMGLQHGIGEGHGMAKLTESQVKAIRNEYVRNSKDAGTKALGKKYGIAQCTVSAIVNRKLWKGVI